LKFTLLGCRRNLALAQRGGLELDISTAQSIKLAIVAATGLSKDALHIYVGMAILFDADRWHPAIPAIPWLASGFNHCMCWRVDRSTRRYWKLRILALAGKRSRPSEHLVLADGTDAALAFKMPQ